MNFTILGEPCSKANSRIMIVNKGKRRCIKSAKAQAYVESFLWQAKEINSTLIKGTFPLKGNVKLACTIYYASYRKDLDESLIMDCLQKAGILKNDRQIKEKHVYHRIDKKNPRTQIELYNISPKG